ncbi:MAG: hypothetical protein P8X90_35720, partial [Desulfobacterales bacterium]
MRKAEEQKITKGPAFNYYAMPHALGPMPIPRNPHPVPRNPQPATRTPQPDLHQKNWIHVNRHLYPGVGE